MSSCWDKYDKDNSDSISLEEFSHFWMRYLKYNNDMYRGLPNFDSMVYYCGLYVDENGVISNSYIN